MTVLLLYINDSIFMSYVKFLNLTNENYDFYKLLVNTTLENKKKVEIIIIVKNCYSLTFCTILTFNQNFL